MYISMYIHTVYIHMYTWLRLYGNYRIKLFKLFLKNLNTSITIHVMLTIQKLEHPTRNKNKTTHKANYHSGN
ncbi:hypothetical protein M5D96_012483, partial [Drosophila gunungcola]